jgi:hypothetical protein
LIASLLFSGMANAQWTGGNPDVITNCNAGVGTTNPNSKLEVYDNSNAFNHMSVGGVGPVIKFYGGSVFPPNNWGPWSMPYSRVALATSAMHFIQSAQAGDMIIQNMGTSSQIMNGGRSILFSARFENGNGVEHMRLNEFGNLSVGPTNAYDGQRVLVTTTRPYASIDQFGVRSVIDQGSPMPPASGYNPLIGVEGEATTTYYDQLEMDGVRGKASNGHYNVGGDFYGSGGACETQGASYGVRGTATGGYWSYGVYGTGTGACGQSWGGWFNGNVNVSGYVYQWSDRQLKQNIRRLDNVLGKVMQLKPSTYSFKSDEYKHLYLPNGEQIGLISQDLESVFPELVKEIHVPSADGKQVEKYKGVTYTALIPVLIAAMQEQQTQISAQNEEIQNLKKVLDSGAAPVGTIDNITLSDRANVIVLNQNTPNPFAESTVITYDIPQDFAKAQIIFSDVNGVAIKTVDVLKKGPGLLNVYANDLTNGSYSYALVIDGTVVASKKMVKQ